MSSADRPRSMAARIAWTLFLAFGLLQLFAGALVLGMTIHHHTADYHKMLERLSADLVQEYASCGGSPEKMRGYFNEDMEEHGQENVFLLISDAQGRDRLHASASESILRQMRERIHGAHPHTYRIERDRHAETGRTIAVRVRKTELADGNILSVGWNVTRDEFHIRRVALLVVAVFALTLLLGGGLGLLLSRRFTTPLRQLAAAARRIGAGDYSTRVNPSREGREIAELEDAFNAMGEQNEKTLTELRVLTDDIAHDLRTPLTRLRIAAEAAATGASTPHALPETVARETGDMLDMINTMLEISQTDRGIDRTPRTDLDLSAFTRGIAELYAALAEDNGQTLTVSVPPGPVLFSGHKGKFQRLLGNLLDNAVKFTPRGGSISVTLSAHPLSLAVSNTGPGLSPDDIPHVFQRFWRADSSRSLPGNGLGLALARAIATSYGLDLSCMSRDGLTTFTLAGRPD